MTTWTKQAIVDAYRVTCADGYRRHLSENQWKAEGHNPPPSTIRRHFGSWPAFMDAVENGVQQDAPVYVGWRIDTAVLTLFLEDTAGGFTAYAWIDEDGSMQTGDVPWPWDVTTIGSAARALRAATGARMREAA